MDSKASDLRSPIPPIPHRRQLCIGYQQSYVLMLNKYSVSHVCIHFLFVIFFGSGAPWESHGHNYLQTHAKCKMKKLIMNKND